MFDIIICDQIEMVLTIIPFDKIFHIKNRKNRKHHQGKTEGASEEKIGNAFDEAVPGH